MINNVVLSGCYKGFEDNNLLLKIEGLENHQIVRIYINSSLKGELQKHLKIDNLVGIKGYIELDDIKRIIIIATIITILQK